MKYCSECGCTLEMRPRHDRQRLCCPRCAFVHYGRFTVGVGALVVEDGRVLLIHRRHAAPTGSWLIPGGYIEQDERIDTAAIRELREETGLEGEVEGIVGVRSRVLAREHSLYVVVKMRPVGGTLRPDGVEVDDARFFSPDEIALLPDVTPFSRWLALQAGRGTLPLFTQATVEGASDGRWVYYG